MVLHQSAPEDLRLDSDTTTPIQGARLFVEAMTKAGNRIEFISPPGAIHTYMFKDKTLFEDTLKLLDAFLKLLALVP
jgi:pyoverdine/dityrosine biosynthesis protein Dit1